MGFTVLPYCSADPILCRRLEEAGCATVMPLGAWIGSNRGLRTRDALEVIIAQAGVPVVVDAGIGVPSDAAEAMEIGADAVLVNTAIAVANDPVIMARAFALAVEAGRLGHLAGRGARALGRDSLRVVPGRRPAADQLPGQRVSIVSSTGALPGRLPDGSCRVSTATRPLCRRYSTGSDLLRVSPTQAMTTRRSPVRWPPVASAGPRRARRPAERRSRRQARGTGASAAREALTLQRFGRAIRLFAPIYISNECLSSCTYCGFSKGLPVVRRTLSPPTRPSRRGPPARRARLPQPAAGRGGAPGRRLARHADRGRRRAPPSVVPQVAIETQTWSDDTYTRLVAAGLEGVVHYQETYDRTRYAEVHLAGWKRDYDRRLVAIERAAGPPGCGGWGSAPCWGSHPTGAPT